MNTRMIVPFALAATCWIGSLVAAQERSASAEPEQAVANAESARRAATRKEQFEQLRQTARFEGSVHAIVELDVPGLTQLADAALAAQTPQQSIRHDKAMAEAIKRTADGELAKLAGTDFSSNRTFKVIPFFAVVLSEDALNRLEASDVVVGIAEDYLLKPVLNNTVNITGASQSWAYGFDGTGWYVAILDSGILDSHEFFQDKNIVQACFAKGQDGMSGVGDCPNGTSTDTSSPSAAQHYPSGFDGWDHGTHVAGIAAGDGPGFPSTGMAPGADLVAIQVFSKFVAYENCDPPGSDCVLTWTSDYIAGLEHVFALRTSYNIASANMSLGGTVYSDQAACDSDNAAPQSAISMLRSVGIVTAVASGNDDACGGVSRPGCVSSAFAVGAVDDFDNEASFSNYHPSMLDVYAPGVLVSSSTGDSNASYQSWNGTSMATPHVAGAIAIMKQVKPSASADEVIVALQSTGQEVDGRCDPIPGQRRIQVDDAICTALTGVTDCNSNGVADFCELGSNDCNSNGVPDDCELSGNDCQPNGIPDTCELAGNDCNANSTPDECDTALGASADCNGNSIPDECENDCNCNGIDDTTDVANEDCNSNNEPDDCDIASGVSVDCDLDGNPDECVAPDCVMALNRFSLNTAGRVSMSATYALLSTTGQSGGVGEVASTTYQMGNGLIHTLLEEEVAEPPLADDRFDVTGFVKSCAVDADCQAGELGPDPQTVCRDSSGDGVPNACYVARQRFLSVKPNPANAGETYAYRISLDTGVAGTAVLGFAAAPVETPSVGPGPSSFSLSRIESMPHYMDWTMIPNGVVSIGDCEISSGHVYFVESILEGADVANDGAYSEPLALPTPAHWGDVTGGGNPGGPPNGAPGSLIDAFAVVKGFQNTQNEPKDWLDVNPSSGGNPQPNLIVTLADAFDVIQAFQQIPYGGAAPMDCP